MTTPTTDPPFDPPVVALCDASQSPPQPSAGTPDSPLAPGLPEPAKVGAFLADYAARLLAAGATCIRIEKNAGRMAKAWGLESELAVFPRHVHLSLRSPGGFRALTDIRAASCAAPDFRLNAQLSRLSWDVADGKVDFATALERYHEICAPRPRRRWLVALLVALANASFCRLFGGDGAAMTVVFVATLAGFSLKMVMADRGMDFRIVVMTCAFVSTVLAAADTLFGLGSTPTVTIATSVLYLVPGIPFINSFCDFVDCHYLCGFGRLMNALIITACLSLGLLGGMMAMNIDMF